MHIGLSAHEKTIKANFGHGARNWGATEFHEVNENESFETELKLKTLDQGTIPGMAEKCILNEIYNNCVYSLQLLGIDECPC